MSEHGMYWEHGMYSIETRRRDETNNGLGDEAHGPSTWWEADDGEWWYQVDGLWWSWDAHLKSSSKTSSRSDPSSDPSADSSSDTMSLQRQLQSLDVASPAPSLGRASSSKSSISSSSSGSSGSSSSLKRQYASDWTSSFHPPEKRAREEVTSAIFFDATFLILKISPVFFYKSSTSTSPSRVERQAIRCSVVTRVFPASSWKWSLRFQDSSCSDRRRPSTNQR